MTKLSVRVLFTALAALLAGSAVGAEARISEEGGRTVLANDWVSVAFSVAEGTFTIRDAQGEVRLADAGVGATTCAREIAWRVRFGGRPRKRTVDDRQMALPGF